MAAQNLLHAYEAGRVYDPQFQVARYTYEAAREKIPQARAELLPLINFDASIAKLDQRIKERDQPIFGVGDTRFTNTSWNFEARQPVFRLNAWRELSQSKTVVRQAYAEFVAAEQDLMLRTVALYLNLLAARDRYDLADAEVTALRRQVELVEVQHRGGLASKTNEYEAMARYSVAQTELIEAIYSIDDAYQALREVVGDAVEDVYPLKMVIPLVVPVPAVLDEWVNTAIEQNLALRAREEAVAVAEAEIRKQDAEHYPSLDVVASYGNIDQGGSVTGGAANVDTATVMLQLQVPIYSGGSVRSRSREAVLNYRAAGEERKRQYRLVIRETRAAFQGVNSAIIRVKAFDASLVSQQSVLDGRNQGYRSGVNTFLEVLNAQSGLYEIRREYATARYQYLLNLLQLKLQAGSLSLDDLLYVNGLLDSTPINLRELSPSSVLPESGFDYSRIERPDTADVQEQR